MFFQHLSAIIMIYMLKSPHIALQFPMKSKVFNSSVLYIIISRSWCTIPLGRNKRALKLLYCIQNRSVFNGTSWNMFIRHTFLRQWIFCSNIWHDLDHNRPFHLDVMFSHFKSRGILVEILQFFFFRHTPRDMETKKCCIYAINGRISKGKTLPPNVKEPGMKAKLFQIFC